VWPEHLICILFSALVFMRAYFFLSVSVSSYLSFICISVLTKFEFFSVEKYYEV